MTEKEKMLAGEVYCAIDPQLLKELAEAREVIHDYNLLRPSENKKKLELLKGLLLRQTDKYRQALLCKLQLHHSRRSTCNHWR